MAFKEASKSGHFSSDWFTKNIPYWLDVLDRYQFLNKKITALEIGSWEGLSSCFILKMLPKAKLICVDTWAGADEHQAYLELKGVEKRFDSNTASYKSRLTKFKGTSLSFLSAQKKKAQFDLIYIDGSHYSDDVMTDAVLGFQQLKKGGIMIFDDYFWCYYPRLNDNPASAINAFLKMKRGYYEILSVYGQVIIRKAA